MYDLKKLRPIRMDDLIRIGRNADGGYILSRRQIAQTEVLLSFGINEDWSFEKAFLAKKKVACFAFDYSVSAEIFATRSAEHLLLMLFYLLKCNIPKARFHGGRWRNLRRKSKDFKRFFHAGNGSRFVRKFLGEEDSDRFIRFDTIFNAGESDAGNGSVFIKMDIENWEYRTLPQLLPFFDKINGMVIEFHLLDIAEKKFEEIINLLSPRFFIAHVHANNAGGYIHRSNLPVLLEITFINKALVACPEPSILHYPVEGLDFPNIAAKEDIPLEFD
ncbi:MAG: hypothetical protein LBS03_09805 [Bacteroidales bacterium]|jgi:hypothetical protein|nr:hypothetical protein [Bacteroidales bacterium]